MRSACFLAMLAALVVHSEASLVTNIPVKESRVEEWAQERAGLRIVVGAVMNMPTFLLLTVVPVFAIHQEVVRVPDVLLSDMMASGSLMRSLYSAGLSLTCMAMIIQWSEVVRFIKGRAVHPELRRALDQFLALVWLVVVPCTFILVSFMFEEVKVAEGASFSEVIPRGMPEFVQWISHVAAASLVFFGLGLCAYLYVAQIGPRTLEFGLEPSRDVKCKRFCASGIVGTVAVALPIRVLHIFHSRELWAYPLLVVEIVVLLLGISASVCGTYGVVSHLDAIDPLLSWTNLGPAAWVGTFVGEPAGHQRLLAPSGERPKES